MRDNSLCRERRNTSAFYGDKLLRATGYGLWRFSWSLLRITSYRDCPTCLHRQYLPAARGLQGQNFPEDTQWAKSHRNVRLEGDQGRLRFRPHTADAGWLMWPLTLKRARPGAYFVPLDRSMLQNSVWAWLCLHPGKPQSTLELHENGRSDTPRRDVAACTFPANFQAVGHYGITRANDFVKSPFVENLHLLFDFLILDHQKPPTLRVPPIRSRNASLKNLTNQSSGTGSGFKRRMARVEWMISNRSVFSAIIFSFTRAIDGKGGILNTALATQVSSSKLSMERTP